MTPLSSGKGSISVAMCTYNGERHLPQQLASILRQTRLPDEVVIHDDGSTDSTPDIAAAFCRQAPFPTTFKVNETNLGSTRNFEQTILACKGDLIALSDQDDIWHRDRLARSEQELIDHPEAGLVFSDGDIIDDFDQPIGKTLWKTFRLKRRLLEDLQSGDCKPLARRTFVTGATVMFRARYAALCFPTGRYWWHDGWLAMLIAGIATIRPIDAPLISYRTHASQQLGLGPVEAKRWKTLEERAIQQAATLRHLHDSLVEAGAAIEKLLAGSSAPRTHRALDDFRGYQEFLAMRLALPENRLARIPIMLNCLEEYRDSGMGVLSMAKDLVFPKVRT